MSDAILPPLFNILTGLSFAGLLVIRFLASKMLKPLWGKLIAFSLVFMALGFLLLSQATAKRSLFAGAEFFTFAGVSIAAAAILVVVGLVLASRSTDGVTRS